jgi:hypothetical protein
LIIIIEQFKTPRSRLKAASPERALQLGVQIPDERFEATIHSVEKRLLRVSDERSAGKPMETTTQLSALRLEKHRIAEIRKALTLMIVLKETL